jgi:hypothetical protein
VLAARDDLTALERVWARKPAGSAVVTAKGERFDGGRSILCSPLLYGFAPREVRADLPSEEWIRDAFLAFVRGDLASSGTRPRPAELRPEIAEEGIAELGELDDYLAMRLEEAAAIGREARRVGDGDLASAVFSVISHPALASARSQLEQSAFMAAARGTIAARERLQFMLRGCPFKDQNPLRTLAASPWPDAGELVFLMGLHALARAVEEVYAPGAEFVVLADGEIYAETFGVAREDAVAYRGRLQELRAALGLQETISVIDLVALVDDLRAASGTGFDVVTELVRDAITGFCGRGDRLGDAFEVLTRGMQWQLAADKLAVDNSLADVWDVLAAPRGDAVAPRLRPVWREVRRRAQHAAIKYAAVNLALRHFDVIAGTFPGAIRAALRPKPGRLTVRTYGAYPWNAVAVRTPGATTGREFESVPLYKLGGRGPLRQVRLRGHDAGSVMWLERVSEDRG